MPSGEPPGWYFEQIERRRLENAEIDRLNEEAEWERHMTSSNQRLATCDNDSAHCHEVIGVFNGCIYHPHEWTNQCGDMQPEPTISGGADDSPPERQNTHHLNDDCPGGHREDSPQDVPACICPPYRCDDHGEASCKYLELSSSL